MRPAHSAIIFIISSLALHGVKYANASDEAPSSSIDNVQVQTSNSSQGHLAFYPEIHADFRSDLDPNSNQDASDTGITAALIYRKDSDKFSLLGEAYATDDDGDMQRLQLGWHYSESGTLWLGKFYNQIGYWNTVHHRGLYHEMSVHRPSIVEYEVDGGILPMLLTGMYVEQKSAYENLAVTFSFAAGKGPELTKDAKLEAFSLFNPGDTENDLSMTAKIAFDIAAPFELKTGLFVSHSTIPSRLGLISEVEQHVFGGYFHSQWSQWSLTWMLNTVSNNVKTLTAAQTSSLGGGYVQLGYKINRHWTGYARIEDMENPNNDVYLNLFPDFVVDRNLFGLRLDFRKNQAITFEILDSDLVSGDHFHTSVQWSAVFDY